MTSALGGIIAGVFHAANAAGGGLLGTLAQLMGQMEKWVKSAQGQHTLQVIFTSLAQIGRALTPVFAALGDALVAIGPEIAAIATAVGPP